MTDVPSNLIPTRISQLPEYTGSSQEGYLPYVYEGVTYKVRFSGVASAGEVPPSRTLTAGTGLTGGGDLSADRVFAISDGGVGADQLDATGVVAGVYGDASNIPTITVDANGRVSDVTTSPIVALGYVPESRVITAGDGLSGGGNLAGDRSFSVNFSSVAPSPLGSASAGVANVAAREDHVHPAVDLSDMTETQGTLPLGRGGTGASLSPIAGAVAYSNGTHMSLTPVGVVGQVLVSGGVNAPSWVTLTGTGTVTSVNIDGATSGLNFIGGPITTAGVFTLQDPGFIQFDTAYGASRNTGRLWWNDDDNAKTFMVGGEGSDVDIKLGEQNYFRIKASAAITKGQVVMFTGTVGASGGLQGAPATGLTKATASYIMGVAAEDIALNGWGYITEFGLIRQLDTTAFSDGDILYYDPDVVGGLRVGAPPAPAAKAELAAVVRSASNGSIFVRATHQFELEQLNDVETAAASDLDLLEYNGSSGVWRHRDPQLINVGGATNVLGGAANQIVYQTGSDSSSFIAAPTSANTFLEWSGSAFQWSSNPLGTVTSVDVSGGTTGLTASGGPITSSGTITLGGTLGVANGGTGATTAAGALTSLGAYPASNPDGYTTNTGTVTSVAATAGTGISVSGSPITTSGTLTITNTAPDQTVTLTQGGTTTITGTYPNFTISSADQYDGTVTSVAATVPTGFTVGGSPITTSGTLAIGFDTGYSLPTDAEQANWDTAYADRYKWDGGSSGLVAATGRTSLGLGTSAVLDAGAAGGVATLDGGGTVPTSQLPAAVLGALKYQGTWNASTNSPTLTSSVGTQGYYYVVSVAGTTNLDGISDWAVGDWAIFNGSTWDKIDNTDAVTSVNGYTGTVVLDYADVGAPSTTGTGASGTWGINVTGNAANVTGTVAVANGGTGATTAAGALTNLGAYAASNPAGYTTNTGTVTSVAASAGTGISITGSPITTSGTLTITNTAPDQTVTLTQAGTTTITGTYPNFTISSADQYSGTVTSVGGTGTVNGLTLSGTVTSSGNLTLGGTLAISNADWSGTDLSVANGGTGTSSLTSGYLLKGNGTSAVSASVIYDNGTNVGIGTSSPNSKVDIEAANSQLRLTDSDDSKFVLFSYSGGKLITRNNSTTTSTEQFTLDESGRIGIGTISPSQTLQVQGTGYATSDFRAPVFYDSDNTGRYLDPSAFSNLGSANFNGTVAVLSNNSLQMRATNNAYQRVDSRVESTNYARAHWYGVTSTGGTTNFRHAWYNGSSYINVTTDATGVDFAGTLRSTLLYDRDNTAYYVNPASSDTKLNGMVSTGRIDMQSTDGYQLESGKHRITYNDGGGNFNIRVGHKYNNESTETGYAGWIEYTQSNGQWEFWTTDASYTAGTTGITFNKGMAITPLNTYLYYNNSTRLTTTNAGLTVTGSGTATTDFRAPIFYDSDNTGYNLNANGNAWQLQTPFGYLRAGPMNTGYCHFNTDRARYYFDKEVQFDGGINDYSGNWQLTDSLGQHNSSLRAPIFYDSNNTAYYVDPASTSILNEAYIFDVQLRRSTQTASGLSFYSPSYDTWQMYMSPAGQTGAGVRGTLTAPSGSLVTSWALRSYIEDAAGYGWTFEQGTGPNDVTPAVIAEIRASDGAAQFNGSVRSPIFYDSANTGYYVDPASTSQLNALTLASNLTVNNGNIYGPTYINMRYGSSGAGGIRLYDADGTLHGYWYGNGGGEHGFLDNDGSWAVRIRTGTNTNLYYCNGQQEFGVATNHTVSYGSSRAPIFYDSDNTAYYADLGSTGSSIRTAGPVSVGTTSSAVQLTVAGAAGVDGIDLQVDTTNSVNSGRMFWTNGTAGQGVAIYNGSGNMYLTTGATPNSTSGGTRMAIYSGNYVTASGSFRAPIFYDSNNTGRYADLASTGDSIRASGDIVAYYSDDRLKDRGDNIANALDKVQSLNGFHYTANETAQKFGYKANPQVGVSAQEVEAILPEVVKDAAIGHGYKTVDYAKLVPLLIEAIKELKAEVETLKKG